MDNNVFWLFNKTYVGDFSLCAIFYEKNIKIVYLGELPI